MRAWKCSVLSFWFKVVEMYDFFASGYKPVYGYFWTFLHESIRTHTLLFQPLYSSWVVHAMVSLGLVQIPAGSFLCGISNFFLSFWGFSSGEYIPKTCTFVELVILNWPKGRKCLLLLFLFSFLLFFCNRPMTYSHLLPADSWDRLKQTTVSQKRICKNCSFSNVHLQHGMHVAKTYISKLPASITKETLDSIF